VLILLSRRRSSFHFVVSSYVRLLLNLGGLRQSWLMLCDLMLLLFDWRNDLSSRDFRFKQQQCDLMKQHDALHLPLFFLFKR
jgi:hypothetical protein